MQRDADNIFEMFDITFIITMVSECPHFFVLQWVAGSYVDDVSHGCWWLD